MPIPPSTRATPANAPSAHLRDARRQVAVDELLQGLDVRQRNLGVGPLDDRAHGGHERERVTSCANGEVLGREPLVCAIRQLSMRNVDLRLADARESSHLYISHDPDDLAIGSGEVEAPPERLLPRKELRHKRRTDDGDRRTVEVIRISNVTALQDGYAERLEEAGCHVAEKRNVVLAAALDVAADPHREDASAHVAERQEADIRGARHARQRANLRQHAIVEAGPCAGCFALGIGNDVRAVRVCSSLNPGSIA